MSNRCPHAGHFMWWSASVLAMPLTSRPGFVICNAYDLVLKDDAFGIVHHEPLIGKVRVCKHLEMVTVADLFLCIDVNPDRFHRSRAGLRRPQWGSLRDGLNSRMWPRFNTFMTSIRANIVAALSNKQECLNGGPPFWFFGLFSREPGHIGSGVMQGDEMAATRDRYRIVKGSPLKRGRDPTGGRSAAICRARVCDFLQQLQADLAGPAPHAKIIRFAATPNHPYNSRHPVLRRGALAIVTNVGTGCGGRGSVRREGCSQGGLP